MDLTKHLSSFLGTGWHRVKIKSFEKIDYKSGNEGYGYDFADSTGRNGHDHFVLVDSSLWKLANFGACVDLTSKQMENFEPEMPIGRKAWVRMAKKGQYHEPVEWAPDSDIAPEAVAVRSEEKVREWEKEDGDTPAAKDVEGELDNSDIPF